MQLEHDTQQKQEQKQKLTYRRTQRRVSRTARTPGPSVPVHASSRVPVRSNTTGLIFQAILGAAACLALVGVVAQTRTENQQGPTSSPDAPPPAVFVHTD